MIGSKLEVDDDFFQRYNENLAYSYGDFRHCEEEPIRFPAAIQPLGYLVTFEARSLRITSISRNLLQELELSPEEIFQLRIGRFLWTDQGSELDSEQLETLMEGPISRLLLRRRDDNRTQLMMVGISLSRGQWIIELEPAEEDINPLFQNSQHTKLLNRRFEASRDLPELAKELSLHVQFLMGFERVLVYRFDPSWAGEVIAEVSTVECENFLGLRFPATDIPASARALYLKSKSRCISDTKMIPVPLIIDPKLSAFDIDLSECVLRSSSSIHIRYLHNMGLRSSFSIPIVVNQSLWGLVSCHHFSGAKHPSLTERQSCELSARLFTAKVLEMTEESRSREQVRVADLVSEVGKGRSSNESFFDTIAKFPDGLFALVECDGVLVRYEGKVQAFGSTPNPHLIAILNTQLKKGTGYSIWMSQNLTKDLEALAPYSGFEGDPLSGKVSGALAIPLSPGFDDTIIWFRNELVQNVQWGGKQGGEVGKGENLTQYSPRSSFAAWTQTVLNESKPWTPSDVDCAHFFLFGLLKTLLSGPNKILK